MSKFHLSVMIGGPDLRILGFEFITGERQRVCVWGGGQYEGPGVPDGVIEVPVGGIWAHFFTTDGLPFRPISDVEY